MIDVVIPVYNTAEYIKRCLESIFKQTYKELNIILVDDGSTDNSGTICDEYAAKYDNITAYHKANGGLSSARNYGIEHSNAEYISFVDCDDYLNKYWYENLYQAIQKYDADMASAGATLVYDKSNTGADETLLQPVRIEEVDKAEMYRRMFAQDVVDVSVCTKLFKAKVFQSIRFPVGELYEDMQTIEAIVEACDKLVVVEDKGYFYYQRPGSIMYGDMDIKRMKLVSCMEGLCDKMAEKYPKALDAARTRCIRCYIHVYNRAIFDNDYKEQARLLRKKIKNERAYVAKSQYMKKHEMIAVWLIMINTAVYKLFLKIYRRNK